MVEPKSGPKATKKWLFYKFPMVSFNRPLKRLFTSTWRTLGYQAARGGVQPRENGGNRWFETVKQISNASLQAIQQLQKQCKATQCCKLSSSIPQWHRSSNRVSCSTLGLTYNWVKHVSPQTFIIFGVKSKKIISCQALKYRSGSQAFKILDIKSKSSARILNPTSPRGRCLTHTDVNLGHLSSHSRSPRRTRLRMVFIGRCNRVVLTISR